jgi:hypothetical protein
MSDNDAPEQLMSTAEFAKLKGTDMKAELQRLNNNEAWGKVMRPAKKLEMINEFHRVCEEKPLAELLEDIKGAKSKPQKAGTATKGNKQNLAAKNIFERLLIQDNTDISNSTAKILKMVGIEGAHEDTSDHL